MLEDLTDHLIGGNIFSFGLKVEDEAVTQCGVKNPLDVIVAHMNPVLGQSIALSAEDDGLRASRARAISNVLLHR